MTRKEETRRYESVTLGLPPLKMILVETEPENRERTHKKTAGPRKPKKDSENRQVILRLIDHLTGSDR